jgi:hypothetical protein
MVVVVMAQAPVVVVVLTVSSKSLLTFRTCDGVTVTVPDGAPTEPDTVRFTVLPSMLWSSGPVRLTRCVDVAADAVTIEVTGTPDKLEAFVKVLEPFGIKELVQSGMVAIGRGARSITDRSLRALDRTA